MTKIINPSTAIKSLGGVKSGRNSILCPGPGHGKRDTSLSVSFDQKYPEGFAVHSFAGDDWQSCRDYVRDKLGLPAWKPNGHLTQDQPTFVVRDFVYLDPTGEEYHRIEQLSDGGFKHYHWDIDGWASGAPAMLVPYQLPDVLTDETIWLVRGELNADLLRDGFGVVATTYPSGFAAEPDPSFLHHFAGRDVRILDVGGALSSEFADKFSAAMSIPVHRLPDGFRTLRQYAQDESASDDGFTTSPDTTSPEAQPPALITPTPYSWQNPTTIPRREWLYGRHLIRRYVSTTISPGGLGKSSMVLVEALAMVSGKPLLEERIHTKDPLRVWYWNGEDPNEEAARRIQAAAIQHKLTPDDLGDRLFVDSGREMRLKLASMVRGEIVVDESLFEEITSALISRRIDVWTIDPFISAHQVSENDNGAIDAVIKRLGIVAERANVAIELVHHVRKGNGQNETTVEDARGASALIGGVRSARVLNVMPKDIADAAKIDPKHRYSHFSVTNGKSNLGPRSDQGLWRKIVSVDLENGGLALDSSDHVGVVIPFQMPDLLGDIPHNAADIAQDVARQFDMGRLSSQSKDWFGHIVGPRIGIDTETKEGKYLVKTLIKKWLDNDVLAVRMGEDANRNKRDFICLPESANPYEASVQGDPDDVPF